ncbi:unnamed protein product, partial [Closterium sp. Naga37s-1]
MADSARPANFGDPAAAASAPSRAPQASLDRSSAPPSLHECVPFSAPTAVFREPFSLAHRSSPLQVPPTMAVAPDASLHCTAASNLARSLSSSRSRRARENPSLQSHVEYEERPETGEREMLGFKASGSGRGAGMAWNRAAEKSQINLAGEGGDERGRVIAFIEQAEGGEVGNLVVKSGREVFPFQRCSLLSGSGNRRGGGNPKKRRILPSEDEVRAAAADWPTLGATLRRALGARAQRLGGGVGGGVVGSEGEEQMEIDLLQSLLSHFSPPETAPAADPAGTPHAVTSASSLTPAHPASIPPSLPLVAAAPEQMFFASGREWSPFVPYVAPIKAVAVPPGSNFKPAVTPEVSPDDAPGRAVSAPVVVAAEEQQQERLIMQEELKAQQEVLQQQRQQQHQKQFQSHQQQQQGDVAVKSGLPVALHQPIPVPAAHGPHVGLAELAAMLETGGGGGGSRFASGFPAPADGMAPAAVTPAPAVPARGFWPGGISTRGFIPAIQHHSFPSLAQPGSAFEAALPQQQGGESHAQQLLQDQGGRRADEELAQLEQLRQLMLLQEQLLGGQAQEDELRLRRQRLESSLIGGNRDYDKEGTS